LTVSASRPGRLGQSMLYTVVSHIPRSSRGALADRPAHAGGCPGVVAPDATLPWSNEVGRVRSVHRMAPTGTTTASAAHTATAATSLTRV